jgi:hypothetical protein
METLLVLPTGRISFRCLSKWLELVSLVTWWEHSNRSFKDSKKKIKITSRRNSLIFGLSSWIKQGKVSCYLDQSSEESEISMAKNSDMMFQLFKNVFSLSSSNQDYKDKFSILATRISTILSSTFSRGVRSSFRERSLVVPNSDSTTKIAKTKSFTLIG